MFDVAKLEEIIAAGVKRGMIEAHAEMLSMQAESAKDSDETPDKPKKTRKKKEKVEVPPEDEDDVDGFDDPEDDDAVEAGETGTDSEDEISKEDFIDEVKRIFKGNVVLAKEFLTKKFKCGKFADFEQKNFAKFLKLAKKDNA